jgi:hypothetical protein
MLKSVTICIMLVAAAAMGWGRLDDVPDEVEHGAHLAWGNGLIWAMLPVYAEGGGQQRTDVLVCYPGAEPDSMWDDSTITPMSSRRLLHAGLTFQWNLRPVLWGCGWHEDGGNEYSKLYRYDVDSALWRQDTIDTFALGDGASITYMPNENWHPINYVCTGWIYCIPGGNTTSFWRYAVDGAYLPDLMYGFYPGPGAIIADQTPHFSWISSPSNQYRIQVSTDQYFGSACIDEVVSTPEYESTTELVNGTYYWRTATWNSGTWDWCESPHCFDLQGGWTSLAAVPKEVTDGAIIAYDKGSFGTGERTILAFPGGGGDLHHYVHAYRYIISQNTWVQLDSVYGEREDDGTSLTTRAPTQEEGDHGPLVMAAFSSEGNGDVPYRYDVNSAKWVDWCNDSGDSMQNSHFPRYIGPYSSMVIGGDDLMYLIPGCDNGNGEDFYYVQLPTEEGGGQARFSRIGGSAAHVITGHDGIEVEYQLPATARVRATLHDAVGRQVSFLDAGEQKSGTHRLRWDHDIEGRRLSAGAYFVLLDTSTEQARLKAVVR